MAIFSKVTRTPIMSTLSTQDIKSLVRIIRPEIIYSAQEKFKGEGLLNRCRSEATNYKAVIEQIKSDQDGEISDAQVHACKEAAHAAVLDCLNTEHLHVIEITQDQRKTIRRIFDKAGTSSVQVICNLLDGVSANLKRTAQLDDSRVKLLRFNNVYRGQKKMTLQLLTLEGIDPTIIGKVEQLYKPQSTQSLSVVWQRLTDWDESETLKLLKKANAFATLTEF
jgi:hypothetical protein